MIHTLLIYVMMYVRCPAGEMFDDTGVCVPITDCSIERCVWGDCVMVVDVDNPPALTWRCNCNPGWTGPHCNETDVMLVAASATVSNGWIGAAVGALILLLSKYMGIGPYRGLWGILGWGKYM